MILLVDDADADEEDARAAAIGCDWVLVAGDGGGLLSSLMSGSFSLTCLLKSIISSRITLNWPSDLLMTSSIGAGWLAAAAGLA